MRKDELQQLIEQVVEQEMVHIGSAALFKEQVMQMVQQAVAAAESEIHDQADYMHVIDREIENIRADMDLTYDSIQRALKSIPFEIFFKSTK